MKLSDKISVIPSVLAYNNGLLASMGKLKWSNKYDCPEGYEYNEYGYVETNENHLQITISMMPFLLPSIGEYEVLYQNAVAFRALNPGKHADYIESALSYKFKTSYYREPDNDILQEALKNAFSVDSLGDILPKMHRSIFSFHSVWRKKDCTLENRKQIYGILRNEFIDKVRSMMTTDTKFKTICVAEATDKSFHIIGKYWESIGMDRKDRTAHALAEALESMAADGIENTTIEEICRVAGLSRSTVGKLLNNN
jgi:hypothetical protein